MAILGGDGSIILTTKIDQSGLNKGMASLKGAITKLGAAIGVAFGVRALVQFGKQAVQLASDLQEVQNVVDVAFGDMAYKIESFSKTAIENFGISELTAKRTASTYMASMSRYSSDMGSAYDDYSEERMDRRYSRDDAKDHILDKMGEMMSSAGEEQKQILKDAMRKIERA